MQWLDHLLVDRQETLNTFVTLRWPTIRHGRISIGKSPSRPAGR